MTGIHEPYGALSVHGILPLVMDERNGSVRFARIGEDHPAKCIGDPSALPDCEITLRLFPDDATLAGWAEAATEFGGNALWIVRQQGGSRQVSCALVLRPDRPRRPGHTVDDCIELKAFPGMDVAAARDILARQRLELAAKRMRDGKRADWDREWQVELGQLAAAGLRVSYRVTGDGVDGETPLLIEIPDGKFITGRTYSVTRVPEGLAVRISLRDVMPFYSRSAIGPELAPERDAAIKRRGLVEDGDTLLKVVPSLEPGIVAAIREDEAEIKAVIADLEKRQQRIDRVRRVLEDERTMAFLRSIHAGHLVVCKRTQDPGAVMTVTGKIKGTIASVVMDCLGKGLLSHAWNVTTDFDPDYANAPFVLTLSRTAKAIMAGDEIAARTTVNEDSEARGGPIRQRTDFAAAMADALGHLDDDALTRLRDLAGRHPQPENSRQFEPWATHAILAGTAVLEASDTPRR